MVEKVVQRISNITVTSVSNEGRTDDASKEEQVEEDGGPDLITDIVAFLPWIPGAAPAKTHSVEAAGIEALVDLLPYLLRLESDIKSNMPKT